MLLFLLPLHQTAVVTALALPDDTRERFSACGLRPGVAVTPVHRTAFSRLTAYRVGGAMLALRAETAKAIEVEAPAGHPHRSAARTKCLSAASTDPVRTQPQTACILLDAAVYTRCQLQAGIPFLPIPFMGAMP